MCDSWGDEPCAVWNEVAVRARKSHVCTGCRETIAAGHQYRRTTTIYDGSVDVFKHCLRCAAMVDALRGYVDSDAFTTDTLYLNCGQVWEDPPEHIAALAFWSPGEPLPARAMEGGT